MRPGQGVLMVRIIGGEHPSQGREDKACELDEGKPFVELDDELRLQGVPSSNDRDRLDHRKDEHGIQAYGDKGASYLCSPGGPCVRGVRLIPVPQHDEHDCGAEVVEPRVGSAVHNLVSPVVADIRLDGVNLLWRLESLAAALGKRCVVRADASARSASRGY